MNATFFTPSHLRIFKRFFNLLAIIFTATLALVSCSAGKDEGSISIALPAREILARAGVSAARDGITDNLCTIFITGDYEAKKTVPMSDAAGTTGELAKATFDNIPAGSKVRVAVSYTTGEESATCGIGVSDEITIIGGETQTANVVMKFIQLTNNLTDGTAPGMAMLYYIGSTPTPDSYISLPSCCYYKFTFTLPADSSSHTYKTSSAFYDLGGSDYAHYYNVTVKIFCNDTEILRLSKAAEF